MQETTRNPLQKNSKKIKIIGPTLESEFFKTDDNNTYLKNFLHISSKKAKKGEGYVANVTDVGEDAYEMILTAKGEEIIISELGGLENICEKMSEATENLNKGTSTIYLVGKDGVVKEILKNGRIKEHNDTKYVKRKKYVTSKGQTVNYKLRLEDKITITNKPGPKLKITLDTTEKAPTEKEIESMKDVYDFNECKKINNIRDDLYLDSITYDF